MVNSPQNVLCLLHKSPKCQVESNHHPAILQCHRCDHLNVSFSKNLSPPKMRNMGAGVQPDGLWLRLISSYLRSQDWCQMTLSSYLAILNVDNRPMISGWDGKVFRIMPAVQYHHHVCIDGDGDENVIDMVMTIKHDDDVVRFPNPLASRHSWQLGTLT